MSQIRSLKTASRNLLILTLFLLICHSVEAQRVNILRLTDSNAPREFLVSNTSKRATWDSLTNIPIGLTPNAIVIGGPGGELFSSGQLIGDMGIVQAANNALTLTDSLLQWGGPLIANTTVTGGGFNVTFDFGLGGSFDADLSSSGNFDITGAGGGNILNALIDVNAIDLSISNTGAASVGGLYIDENSMQAGANNAVNSTQTDWQVDHIAWNTDGTEKMRLTSAGNLGVGTISPIGILHIGAGSGTASTDPAINVRRQINDDDTGNAHAFSDGSNISRSGNIGYNSFDGRVTFSDNDVNYDHYAPFQSEPNYNFPGDTISNHYGIWERPVLTAGTIYNRFGIDIEDPSGAGTDIINNYPLFVNTQTKGVVIKALYIKDQGDTNHAIHTEGGIVELNTTKLVLNEYGAGNKEATDFGLTNSNYISRYSTTGVLLDQSISGFKSEIGVIDGTAGSVFFSLGAGLAEDNSNLYYSQGTVRLGIGTNSPGSIFHLKAIAPQIIIQDGDSADDTHLGYLSFRNSANSEIVFFGLGSTGNNDFTIQNNDGSVNLTATSRLTEYGIGNKTASALGKSLASYVLRPATDGTVLEQTLTDFSTELGDQYIGDAGPHTAGAALNMGGFAISNASTITAEGTINANSQGTNIRVKGDGTSAGDYALLVSGGGDLWISNWALTRGLRLNASGTTQIFGGGEVLLTDYGSLNKEASDLSKTINNYLAVATDGTLLDISTADLATNLGASGGGLWTDGGSHLRPTTSTDKIGIGFTSVPSAQLHVSVSSGEIFRVDGSGGAGKLITDQTKTTIGATGTNWVTGLNLKTTNNVQGGLRLTGASGSNSFTSTSLGSISTGDPVDADFMGWITGFGSGYGMWIGGVGNSQAGLRIEGLNYSTAASGGSKAPVSFVGGAGDGANGKTIVPDDHQLFEFQNNGTQRLIIDGDGETTILVDDAGQGLIVGNAMIGLYSGSTGWAQFAHSSQALSSGGYAVLQDAGGATKINAPAGNNIQFRINNSDVMTMDVDGLGINHATPSVLLDIKSNTTSGPVQQWRANSGGIRAQMYEDANQYSLFMYGDTGGSSMRLSGDNHSYIGLEADDNFGLGVAAPTEKLEVMDGNIAIDRASSGTARSIKFQNVGVNQWQILNTAANPSDLQFWDNNNVRITFKNGGNVGIGTTSPTYGLDVNSSFRVYHSGGVVTDYTGSHTALRSEINAVRSYQIDDVNGSFQYYDGDDYSWKITKNTGEWGVGTSNIVTSARMLVRGYGTSGGTYPLILENSAGSDLFYFIDNGVLRGLNYGALNLEASDLAKTINNYLAVATDGTILDISTADLATNLGVGAGSYTAGSVLFADSDGSITEDNSNLFWDDAQNELGIGTTSPVAKLDVTKSTTATSGSERGSYIELDVTPSAASTAFYENVRFLEYKGSNATTDGGFTGPRVRAGFDYLLNTNTGTGIASAAHFAENQINDNANASKAFGSLVDVVKLGANGTITDAYGLASTVRGKITNGYGLYTHIENYAGSSPTTTYLAYLDGSRTMSTTTTKYGLYQIGTDNINYLEGNVGIGTTSPNKTVAGKALTIESSTFGALEFSSTAADADNQTVGELVGWYATNSASHDEIAQIQFVTDGSTANQRGGEILFKTKPDGATVLTTVAGIGEQGQFYVGTENTFSFEEVAFVVDKDFTGETNTVIGADIRTSNTSTGNITALRIAAQTGSGADPTSVTGLDVNLAPNQNTISTVYGALFRTPVTASATSVSTTYAIHILEQNTTETTTAYGVYQAGANTNNYFAGNTGIGTTSPDALLDVEDTSGPQARLTYNGSNYTDFETTINGRLYITPSGSRMEMPDNLSGFTWEDQITSTDYKYIANTTDTGVELYTSFSSRDIIFKSTSGPTNAFRIDSGNGQVEKYAGEVESGSTTPAQLTASVNNYALTVDTKKIFRISSNAGGYNITGINAPAVNGTIIYLLNVNTSNSISLSHNSASSTAANRILTAGGASRSISANGSVTLWYDGTSSRWRVVR